MFGFTALDLRSWGSGFRVQGLGFRVRRGKKSFTVRCLQGRGFPQIGATDFGGS